MRARIPEGAEGEVVSSDLRRARRTAEEVADLFGVQPTWIKMPPKSPSAQVTGSRQSPGALRQHHHAARRRFPSQPPGRQPRRHPPSRAAWRRTEISPFILLS
ncbi:histidine phosphatase family protein [Streptomyces ipomoeae]|uniref:histidine phosphatase family protein n=1 Tax=Streptomyces ipomoeae TaxID=103232 RepID=UPI00215C4CD9|nr:histidine phosphatase family protein [Streptomyces ipomoeae]